MPAVQETVDQVRGIDVDQYKYGFETLIESDKAPKGLSEDTVRFISAKKSEPDWMLAWRLDAYKRWLTMQEPKWAKVEYGPIDYQDLYYYSAPKKAPQSLDEIDPEILRTYEKLGIPLREREALLGIKKTDGGEDGAESENGNGYRKVAVDAVFDSVSVATTFQAELAKAGVLFMPISEAIQKHPELVKKYLGTVVPISDNFLRHAQYGGVFRRLVCLRAAGCALPHGAVDLFPHQRAQYRPVRAHADHRRPRLLCELSRRLHRADARREPAPRRSGRIGRARRRRDQIFDHPELVSGRRQGQGRRLQFRHQARRLPRQERKDFLDPARDRLGDHLEISELHPARRQFARRVLLDRHLQRVPAGRFRHENAAPRQEHHEPHHQSRASPPAIPTTPIAASSPRTAAPPAHAISPIAIRS